MILIIFLFFNEGDKEFFWGVEVLVLLFYCFFFVFVLFLICGCVVYYVRVSLVKNK